MSDSTPGRYSSSFSVLKWLCVNANALYVYAGHVLDKSTAVSAVFASLGAAIQLGCAVTYMLQRGSIKKEELKSKPNSINVPMPVYKAHQDSSSTLPR